MGMESLSAISGMRRQLTELPLLALLSRDITAGTIQASEEHLWLEELRVWCLVEFLSHIRRGNRPPDRLDEVAQKLRQCVDGYPVKREWANLFWLLRSPTRSHEELHAHLKSKAADLRRSRQGSSDPLSSAHENLLRDLELIDEPETARSGKHDTNYDFHFASHYGRPTQTSTPHYFGPISARAAERSGTELDDDDFLPGVHIVPAEGSGQTPPPPFLAVELNEDDTPEQQEIDKKVVEYLSIEEQQRLPFSWLKPNRHERDLLTAWVKDRWSSPDSPDSQVAALMYLSAQIARPVRLALRMEISTTTDIDWRLDPQSWALHRLPPRRTGGARATGERLDHVQPLALRIVIELPDPLRLRLSDWQQQRPTATTLAELIDPDTAMEAKVRLALKEFAPRLTPATLGAWLPQLVFEKTRDPVLTHLLSSNSRTALPGACGYASYNNSAIPHAVLVQPSSQLRIDPPTDASTPLNCAGSELRVNEQWLRDQLGNARQRVDSLSGKPSHWIEYHNALTTYVTLVLLAATGGRVIKSPFEAISDLHLDDDQGIAYIEDKVVSTMHAGRLVPLARRAVRLVRLRYLPWLEQLSSILSHVRGSAPSDIKHLGKRREHSQLPFLFYLACSKPDELGHLEVSESSLVSIGQWDRLFDPNVFRHRLSTWLKEHGPRGGSTHEVINGLLGHSENGTVTWGPYSTRCWADDAITFRPLLNKALMALEPGLPRRFDARPDAAQVSKLGWPANPVSVELFGRQARKLRQEAAVDNASKAVVRELNSAFADLQARNALSNPAELDRIAQSMLTTSKGLPMPRGALRYQAFCEKVRDTWKGPGAKAFLRRRYIPQLEEATPFDSSAPHALELLKAVREWYERSPQATDGNGSTLASVRLAAAIGLLLDARVTAPAVLDAVLNGKHGRLVKMNERYHFEYSKQLSTDPLLPTLRWAITARTARALSLAYAEVTLTKEEEEPAKRRRPLPRASFPELTKLLGLRGIPRAKVLAEALADVVRQANWQQLPGVCAAYLDGTVTSVGLDHSSWHRLYKGTALLAEAHPSHSIHTEQEDWTRAIELASEDDLSKRRESARRPEGFSPAISPSAAISPLAGRKRSKKKAPKDGEEPQARKSPSAAAALAAKRKARASVAAAPAVSSPAEIDKASGQENARALFVAVAKALKPRDVGLPSRRRQVALALRQAVTDHTLASPTCLIYVDWTRSLCWEEVAADELLTLSSIDRYFDALAGCFERLGYQHDLRSCDEEEVTSFYVNVMNARRQTLDVNKEEQYKTWVLALSLLKRFHRFAAHYYDVEDPDWAEIDGDESTLSISPRLVLETEYLHAFAALVGNAEEAQEEATTLGFMLLLAMRFGLRGGEAAKLKQADWVSPDGKSRIVLVRNNRMRELKTVASRRQVPLLFKLTPFEEQVIARHFEKLDAVAARDDNKPLFPLLAIDDNDAATRAAMNRISQQLKRSTKNDRVSVHSARHSFGHMIWCLLMDVPDAIRRGLFTSPPDRNWATHVRELVLCDSGVTRRSPWAIARLMGHAHPRTSLRSYVHLLPDVTDALIDHLDSTRLEDLQPGTVELYFDLDSCPRDIAYLADASLTPLPAPRKPTVVKALQAMRMFHAGSIPKHIASSCDLDTWDVEKLIELLAEVDAILARYEAFNPKGRGPSRLLSHIRFRRFEDLIERAENSKHLVWQPAEATGREYLRASTLFGPSRQLVLFSPAQFEFFSFVARVWDLGTNDFRIVGVRGLDPDVEGCAIAHGLAPTRAEDFVYETKRPKKRKRASKTQKTEESQSDKDSASRRKLFQADSVSIGRPPNPVRHRCVVLCAPHASRPKWNSYELLLIVLVQLYLHIVETRVPHADTEAPVAAGL
jgi:integrase